MFSHRSSLIGSLLVSLALAGGIALAIDNGPVLAKEKIKVLYHVDGKDLATATYAMALINKHIEAEGGPENIDVKLVVHGPALELFKEESVDPQLKAKLKAALDKGIDAEMCQVSMKLFGTPLEKLVAGFQPTEHPVAVKRIADLQQQGYIYIKP